MKLPLFLFMLFCTFSFGQEKTPIDTLNKYIEIQPMYFSEGVEMGISNFDNLKNKKFQLHHLKTRSIGKEYWGSFFLKPIIDKEISVLEFSFPYTDRIEVYVPIKKGTYQIFEVGMATRPKEIYKMEQTSTLYVDGALVDFDRPFLFKNVPMSFYGLDSLNEKIYVMGYGSPPLEINAELNKTVYKSTEFEFKFVLLLGMIIISFVFMFVHYVITKHNYFLFYSLYLFFLIFNYGYRTPYFYNIYSQIHENLYFYLNQNGQLLSFFCYMLFIKYFIGIKENYVRLNVIYNFTLILFLSFIAVYNFIIIINPYFPYHDFLMKSGIYLFVMLSFVFVIYMFIKKRLVHTAVVFIGSMMLLMGYISAIIFRDFFVLVPLVVVETIFFISVIAYLDLRNFKRAFEVDKLKEIDEFKSRFFTNISHEFRTPLTLIYGPLQDQLNSTKLSQSERKNLHAALRSTQRLKDLVDQLLALSKLESKNLKLNVQQSNLPQFLMAQAEAFSFNCSEKNVDYKIKVEKDEIVDWFDQDILEKILYNLIGNAIKYTPENGEIIIEGKRRNNEYSINVKNNGNYIAPQLQEKIFERFYQSNHKNPGAGIGLALTKELVELHYGSIFLKSEQSGFTEFSISFPTNKEVFASNEIFSEAISKEETSAPIMEVFGVEKNVPIPEDAPILLIVDDSEDIRDYVSSIFETTYIIHTANEGKAAFDEALKHIPDIVISDVMMPGEDGFSFTKKLKEHPLTSHIPVILLTAKTQVASQLEGMGIGADAYVTKPFNPQLLKANVDNLIENRRKLQQRFSQEVILMPKDIAVSSADEQFLERLQKVLEKHLTDPDFSAEIFGNEMGVSRMQLHRKLKALTGQSTTEFLRSQRLKLALHLLREKNVSISEVGYAVGFNDPSYFTRCFKQEFGSSPSEYISH